MLYSVWLTGFGSILPFDQWQRLVRPAVKWVAATPGLMNATASSTIVGMSRPERVDQTLELAGVHIPDELWDEIFGLAAPESAWLH
jgi:aryl-alcohol dehydrogenase-like predicted oxidoreductase